MRYISRVDLFYWNHKEKVQEILNEFLWSIIMAFCAFQYGAILKISINLSKLPKSSSRLYPVLVNQKLQHRFKYLNSI